MRRVCVAADKDGEGALSVVAAGPAPISGAGTAASLKPPRVPQLREAASAPEVSQEGGGVSPPPSSAGGTPGAPDRG